MTKKSQGYNGPIDPSVCLYCKEPVNEATRTADHMIPESRDGVRSNDNKAPSCSRCNRIKDDMTVEEFKEFMERVIALEYHYTKVKTNYFKRVAMSCKQILQNSTPRTINFNDGKK